MNERWLRTGFLVIALAASSAFLQCAAPHAESATRAKRYVCPPCGGGACDARTYEHPGTCPICGMPLVEEGSPGAHAPKERPLAILVFDGVEIIDFAGPWEVFGAAGFDVYTVAATRETVTTAMGMKLVPQYTFADAPPPEVLLVPGGGVAGVQRAPETLRWIRETSGRAQETLSVCNGAFILASAGLLDGLRATTTEHLLAKLGADFPKTTVVSDERYVDTGRILTSAGLSAGIDGALHVVERVRGKGWAEATALQLEYDWHPGHPFVRARLADHLIPNLDLDSLGEWAWDKTEGTTEAWEIVLRGRSPKSAPELHQALAQGLEKGGWRRTAGGGDTSSAWQFQDDRHLAWNGALAVDSSRGAGEYVVTVSDARAK